jgi:hypothetical protein
MVIESSASDALSSLDNSFLTSSSVDRVTKGRLVNLIIDVM